MSKPINTRFQQMIFFLKALILPLLFSTFPTLYHYGNNVVLLNFSSLLRMLALNAILATVFYLVIAIFYKFRFESASLGAFIFLIYFNLYGWVYRHLLSIDIIRIKHYTLLPLILMIAIYSIWLFTRLRRSVLTSIWNYLLLITVILIAFNLATIIPAEFQKWKDNKTIAEQESQKELGSEKYPDIYYIVLDEFAGFQAMREYWGYDGVDDFAKFLSDRGFFVAEESHGSSTDTLHQMATRLNYKDYPFGKEYTNTYFDAIADNQVIRYLKSKGYTTVVFDEGS